MLKVLQKFLGLLLPPILEWMWRRASAYIKARKNEDEVLRLNREVRELQEKAKTPEERDKAAVEVIKRAL